jgi:hypothetical protein
LQSRPSSGWKWRNQERKGGVKWQRPLKILWKIATADNGALALRMLKNAKPIASWRISKIDQLIHS